MNATKLNKPIPPDSTQTRTENDHLTIWNLPKDLKKDLKRKALNEDMTLRKLVITVLQTHVYG